jgi:DNA-binding beta-propeller fold protein YncE
LHDLANLPAVRANAGRPEIDVEQPLIARPLIPTIKLRAGCSQERRREKNGTTGLKKPCGVVVDPRGNVYVADHGNIRPLKLAAGLSVGGTIDPH